MAQSSFRKLHPVDPILSQLAVEAIPSDAQLIHDKVLDIIPVSDRAGTILIDDTRNYMGAVGVEAKRAVGADRQLISNFDPSSTSFKCDFYSYEDSFALQDIKDNQLPRNYEERAAKKVGRALKLNKEKQVADLLFSASNWGAYTSTLAALGNGSAGTAWSSASAQPLKDLDILKDVVRANSHGIKPDTLVLGYSAIRALGRNPEVRGIFYETSGAAFGAERIMAEDQVVAVLKSVLRIPNIFVGEARIETALPGVASSESDIWTPNTVFMGIMKGSDSVETVNGVQLMPVAAVELQYESMMAGTYDSINRIRRHVYVDQCHAHKVLAQNYGFVLTSCL